MAHVMPRRLCQPLHTSIAPIAVRNMAKTLPSRMDSGGGTPRTYSSMAPITNQPERNRIDIPATILAVLENRWLRARGSLGGVWTKNAARKRRYTAD